MKNEVELKNGLYIYDWKMIYIFSGESVDTSSKNSPQSWTGVIYKYYDFVDDKVYHTNDKIIESLRETYYPVEIIDERIIKRAMQRLHSTATKFVNELTPYREILNILEQPA